MGEVLGGIMLGPTVFGAIDPGLQAKVFASDITPYIGVAANLGLIFYMFLIGLEVDFSQIKGRVGTTLAVSNTGLAVPMMLGMASAIPLYEILAPEQALRRVRAVHGRVDVGHRLPGAGPDHLRASDAQAPDRRAGAVGGGDRRRLGLVPDRAGHGGGGRGHGLDVLGRSARSALRRRDAVRSPVWRAQRWPTTRPDGSRARGSRSSSPACWPSVATDKIGVAVIFGAFVMGLTMPRHAGLTHEVTERVEDFVLTILLPLFFATPGCGPTRPARAPRADPRHRGLIMIAIAGKYGGTLIAARTMKMPWRESPALGALMNTRGLTELIVLDLRPTWRRSGGPVHRTGGDGDGDDPDRPVR